MKVRIKNILRLFVALLAVLLLPVLVSAQDASGDNTAEQARNKYQEGIELYDNGQFNEAAKSFREAYSYKASWKMWFNIGQSEAAAQRYGLALDAFEEYLVRGGDNVTQERNSEVAAEIKRLRILVGVIELVAPSGAELFVDDISRGTVPFEGPVRVAAGKHIVVVRNNGEIILETRIKVAGEMTSVLDATGKVDSAGEEDSQPQQGKGLLIGGIVAGSVGLLGAGLGTAFLIKGNSDSKTASDSTDSAVRDDYLDNKLPVNRALTITGFAIAGVGIAVGAVLIALHVKKKKSLNTKTAIYPAASGFVVTF